MSKRRVFVLTATAMLVGLTLGAWAASWFWLDFNAGFMNSNLAIRTQADLVGKVSVLQHLRAGRAENATKLLETFLDGDLITAGALARDGHTFNANARRAAALELEARQRSGYEPTEPTVRAAVQEAFRLLSLDSPTERREPGSSRIRR